MRYVVFALVSALPIAWAGGMLYFWMPWQWLGIVAALVFWSGCVYSFVRWRWSSVKWMVLAYALLVGWWFAVPAFVTPTGIENVLADNTVTFRSSPSIVGTELLPEMIMVSPLARPCAALVTTVGSAAVILVIAPERECRSDQV